MTIVVHETGTPAGQPPVQPLPTEQPTPAAPEPLTPSQAIIRAGIKTATVRAGSGKTYGLKRLTPLDRMMVFKAIGSEEAQNVPYVSYALIAASVSSIDGAPEALPRTQRELEALVGRIGEDWDEVNEAVIRSFGGDGGETADAGAAKN